MPKQDTSRKAVPGKPGMTLRGNTYEYRKRVDGKRRWFPLREHGVNLDEESAWALFQVLTYTPAHKQLVPSNMTFAECGAKAVAHYPKKPSTKKLHEDNLRLFPKELREMRVVDVNVADLKRLVITPMRERGNSGSHIHNRLMTCSLVFDQAIEENLLDVNPVKQINQRDKPSRVPTKPKRICNAEELNAILENTSTGEHKVAFALMGLAGLRKSEALGAEWQYVNFATGKLMVQWQADLKGERADPKTKASRAEVVMSPSLQKILAAYNLELGGPTEGKIIQRLDQRGALRRLEHACKRAGIAEPYPTPHDLRHSFASALMSRAKSDGDIALVAGMLRHESSAITLGTYTHEWAKDEGVAKAAGIIDSTIGSAIS